MRNGKKTNKQNPHLSLPVKGQYIMVQSLSTLALKPDGSSSKPGSSNCLISFHLIFFTCEMSKDSYSDFQSYCEYQQIDICKCVRGGLVHSKSSMNMICSY